MLIRLPFFCFCFLLLAYVLAYAQASFAQSYSIDGNRWYEVEISIFTNQSLGILNLETAERFNTTLTYPNTILELQSASASLAIEFESPDELLPQPFFSRRAEPAPVFGINDNIEVVEAPVNLGPVYSPGTKDFHITNPNVDPFILLTPQFHGFTDLNQKLNRSPRHRLLYHAVWRQPMLTKNQASAIFIRGGDQFGEHSELEGSVTFNFNVNRIDADVNLWRNTFTAATNPTPWLIPHPVFFKR